MGNLKHTINAVIFKGDESGYVCTSPDIPIITQGASLNETVSNLREAIALHFDGETFTGFTEKPLVVITLKPETVTDNTLFYPNQ
ncbi:MAG TPA: type II toxin-antitoxin system HicB family antitoxin [Spirochaetota bacterium]|nr:type II toxin-antitoxin system HicB family antitoxin [Spirochaetota bacterium]